jgi:hypothetical protein
VAGVVMPDFDSAVADFTRFAAGQGYPSTLLWSSPDFWVFWWGRLFVLVLDPEGSRRNAKAIYETAVARNIGVHIEGKCKTQTATICRVYVPNDDLDAQYRMIPKTGVKTTVVVEPLPVVLIRHQILWGILKSLGMASPSWE